MPKASKKSSWSSSLVGMLPGRSPSKTKKNMSSSAEHSSSPTLISSCRGDKRHFAHFKDALKTKEAEEEEEELPRCSSVSCSYGGATSPVVSSKVRRSNVSSNTSCSSPASNVIARLMGLEELHSPKSKMPMPASPSLHRHPGARSPVQNEQNFTQQQKWVRSPRRTPPRMMDSGHTQEFLDEMEDHLRQCDRALERIEAVMQLKKRLLYMSRSREDEVDTYDGREPFYSYKSPSRDFHTRKRQDTHVRAKSMDQIQQEQSFNNAGRYYSDTSTARGASNMLKMESKPSHQQQQAKTRHRTHGRSNSDGATPIFSPQIVHSPPARPPFRPRRHLTVEEACNLSRSILPATTQLKPVIQDNSSSEQPSPVSVLENNDSSGSSEECEDFGRSIKCRVSSEKRKSKVVRALWTGAAQADKEERQCQAQKNEAHVHNNLSQDIDFLTWSDHTSEVEMVAVVLECMIFKRLVEETISQLL